MAWNCSQNVKQFIGLLTDHCWTDNRMDTGRMIRVVQVVAPSDGNLVVALVGF